MCTAILSAGRSNTAGSKSGSPAKLDRRGVFNMFNKSADLYDAIYSWKNYSDESLKLERVIEQYKQSPGRALLDVACGTGAHIPFLRPQFAIEGLDIDPGLLAIA